MTFLIPTPCPRHNTIGVCHLDYGDIDYQQDQYFEQFGGYRSFQGMIYDFHPNVYEILGGQKFLPHEQAEEALKALDTFREGNEEGFRKVFLEYVFEVNDMLETIGFQMPDSIVQDVKDERLRRRSLQVAKNIEIGIPDVINLSFSEEQQMDIRESPTIQELNEILDGKWSGKPHWAIED